MHHTPGLYNDVISGTTQFVGPVSQGHTVTRTPHQTPNPVAIQCHGPPPSRPHAHHLVARFLGRAELPLRLLLGLLGLRDLLLEVIPLLQPRHGHFLLAFFGRGQAVLLFLQL